MKHEGMYGTLPLIPLALFLFLPRRAYPAYDYRYGNYGYSNYYSYGYHPNAPIISLELDAKKSRDADLRIAARENRSSDLLHLLEQGANVNAKSDEGDTALIYAARSCALESAEILLERRADVNDRDLHGRTALVYAVTEGCLSITQMFLKIPGIVLNVQDDQRLTVLDYAEQGVEIVIDGPPIQILHLVRKAWEKTEKIPESSKRRRRFRRDRLN